MCLFLHPFFQFNRENINNNIKFRIKMIKNKTKNNQFTIKYEHKKNWNFYFRVEIFSVFFFILFFWWFEQIYVGYEHGNKRYMYSKEEDGKKYDENWVCSWVWCNELKWFHIYEQRHSHTFIYLFIFFIYGTLIDVLF